MTTAVKDREAVAVRLLDASARHSFDPAVDVDWTEPVGHDRFFLSPRRVSLFGTPLWDQLTREQQVELSKHELCSMASIGIWFEVILMQMLLRHAYDRDPQSAHVQYALTEIADECRHSVMFARMTETLGCPAYRPDRVAHELGRVMKTTSTGPSTFAAALIAEEILDTLQREAMADESLHPIVRQVSRIHVVEEARHVRYAREAVTRYGARMSPLRREPVRWSAAWSAQVITSRLIHPDAYAAVGLDPERARAVAAANPQYQETLRWAAARLVEFFSGAGLIGGPSARVWRKAGLLG